MNPQQSPTQPASDRQPAAGASGLSPGAALPAPASERLSELGRRRVRLVLAAGCALTGLAALGWCLVFLLRGHLLAAACEALVLACALAAEALARRGRMRAASRLLVGVLFVFLCACALVLDVPSPGVPRSIHAYLFALGVVAALLLHDEPAWLRHGAPLLCLAASVVFAGTGLALPGPLALPDSLRAPTVWVNHAGALLMVYVSLRLMQADLAERNGMQAELREALINGEMLLVLQPQVDTSGRAIGAEALLRWRHPRRGMVPPGEFIPLAERSGLMLPLGDWVLRSACGQLAAWRHRNSTAGLVLAVNVSAVQFTQHDFVARVLAALQDAGADPARLKLELTESMLAHDLADIVAKMSALKAHGIGLSLDDFGTGFSSLSYLRQLPLDQLKIDQSFVADMLRSSGAAAIAQTVITLGHSLGLQVIAEGVESEEQRQFLAGLGCDAYQGYLFSRPLPLAAFEAWVARAQPVAAAVAADAGLSRPISGS